MSQVRPKSTKTGASRPTTGKIISKRNGQGRPSTSTKKPSFSKRQSLIPRQSLTPNVTEDVKILEADVHHIMMGDMLDLPSVSSNVIRIFVSSTFSDMRAERDRLMESTFPKLKKYCMDTHGLQFQVVDMRWGVRDESTDDHMTTKLCLKELENCQQISAGPNFIAIIGQRYGYRPIPLAIKDKYYDQICETCNREDRELLHKWYKLDENITSPGPMYTLLPVSAVHRHYLYNKNYDLRKEANKKWQEDSKKLTRIMHYASEVMIHKGKLSTGAAHQILMSVTEREVYHGCLSPTLKNISDQCLVFVRTISNIEEIHPSHDNAIWSFKDIKDDGSDDKEAKQLLADLRVQLIKELPENNITELQPIEWKNGGQIREHLDTFESALEAKVKTMVNEAMLNRKTNADPVYSEALRHLTQCKSISSKFKGREDLLNQISKYINDPVSNHPLIIYGKSGSGKTSLMAKSFHMVTQKRQDGTSNPVCMIRFLGTSQFSSSLIPLIRNLCRQICTNYGIEFTMYTDINQLTTFFKKLLWDNPTEDKPIYIFLDSLDQLSPTDGAHELSWLPAILPPHVKLVISFALLPELNLLAKAQQAIGKDAAPGIKVPQLGEDLGAVILKSHLTTIKRKLTEDQEKIALDAIKKCKMPLYVTLVMEEASRWKSFDPPNVTVLADTIHGSIMLLFQRLESKHGEILVKQALRYLTASKHGITENELEDLLSLDEDVLNDVYQYHLPPSTMRRIPPLLWTRLRADMEAYITDREADGTSVICWYHRQFITSAEKWYFENQNGNVRRRIHSNMADYFLGIWYKVPKPFRYTERQMMLNPPAREAAVDRQVAEQPLIFDHTQGTRHYNLRKLNELPYHLMRGNRLEELYNHVLFDIEWIVAKIKGVSVTEVIVDYIDALSKKQNTSVQLVHDVLKLGLFAINQCPDMAIQEITSRLLPYYKKNEYKLIRQLIQQCDTKGLAINSLVPIVHSNHTPGGPLMFMLEGHPWAATSVKILPEHGTLVSASNMIISWDITTGEFLKDIKIPNFTGVLRHMSVSPNGTTAIACSHKNDIFLFNLATTKFQQLPKLEESQSPIWGTCISNEKIWLFDKSNIFCLDMAGKCVDIQTRSNEAESIVHVNLNPNGTPCYIIRTGLETDEHDDTKEEPEKGNDDQCNIQNLDGSGNRSVHLEFPNADFPTFFCRGPLCYTEDLDIYACQTDYSPPEDPVVHNPERHDPVIIKCYKYINRAWSESHEIGGSTERMFSITVSKCSKWLAGTTMYGFQIWNLLTLEMTEVKLPGDHRNLPNRKGTSQLLCFSNCSTKMATAVREMIYVWDLNDLTREPRRLPSIHYMRIISLQSVPPFLGNKMISASFDRSINVWNFDNIRGITYTVEKHDRPIEEIAISTRALRSITVTQKAAKVWDMHTGECLLTINASMKNSKITTCIITSDGTKVISAETTATTKFEGTSITTHETGLLNIWEVETGNKKMESSQTGTEQLMLIDNEKMVLALSYKGHRGHAVCRSMATGKLEYQFEFKCAAFHKCIAVGNKLVIPAIEGKQDVLDLYHARTGSEQHPSITLVCGTYQDVTDLKLMTQSASVIVVRPNKATIYDTKTKKLIKFIPFWNGACNPDGTLGLVAKDNGELQIVSTDKGTLVKSLLPRSLKVNKHPHAMFSYDGNYVLYCDGTFNTLLVIRVEDASIMGRYYSRAKITSIAISQTTNTVIIGKKDGRCNTLLIADPVSLETALQIGNLPSRAGSKLKFRDVIILTKIKQRVTATKQSRACAIS